MGQVLHSSAKTTHAVRAAIQRSQASLEELAATYGINPKPLPSGEWKMPQWGPKHPTQPYFRQGKRRCCCIQKTYPLTTG